MGPKKIAAYLVFAGEMREPTKAELIAAGDAKPGMGDIAKRVGEKWKLLSEDEKAAYKAKAETINAENEREYAAKIASGEIVEGGEDDKEDAEPDLSLPLARVKRIMRLDKEVKNTAVDACRLVSRATELFVESLVEGAYHTMKQQKRKTVKHADVEHHVLRKPRLEFLHDHGTFFFFLILATLATPAIVAAARGARSRRTSTDHVPHRFLLELTASPHFKPTSLQTHPHHCESVWAMRPTAAQKDKENVEGDGDDDAPKAPPAAPTGARQVTEFFGRSSSAGVGASEAPTEPAASNAAPP